MRRRLARPFGQSISSSRMFSSLMALAVLWVLYARFRDPTTWAWMTHESLESVASAAESETPVTAASDPVAAKSTTNSAVANKPETIVPGPNEEDGDALLKLRKSLGVVEDKTPLQPHEMLAYWQLMAWSRTRPFADFEKTAQRDVPFAQLWAEPDLFRGHAIRLRMHVRRILKFTVEKNPLELKEVFELWGWTEDSRSYPFVVVLPELPAGLKVGTDVSGEVVFVGYFLKWMSYQTFDTKKVNYSPLLVGRCRTVAAAGPRSAASGWEAAFLVIAAGIGVLGFTSWYFLNSSKRGRLALPPSATLPDSLPESFFKMADQEPSPNDSPADTNPRPAWLPVEPSPAVIGKE